MESIILTPVICKVIEIIGTISGGLVATICLKKLKEKFYDTHGCNSKCVITCESFFNKTNEIVRNLSTKHL